MKLPKGIDLMPSGKYKATASIGSGNTRKRKSKSFTTVSDAKVWLLEMNADMHSGTTYVGDDAKITDAYNEWVATFVTSKVSPATEKGYYFTGNILAKYCEGWLVKTLDRRHCQKLFNQLIADNYTKNTIKKIKVHVGKYCRSLVTEGVIKRNPMQEIDIRGARLGKDANQKFISISQYKQLLQALKQRPISQMTPYTMVILVILCTGMRVSEAIDLRQDDLDEIKLTLRVDSSYSRTVHDSKTPKTKNSYRTIPIPKFLLQRLREWRFEQNRLLMLNGHRNHEQHLFITKFGNVPDASSVNYYVQKLEHAICQIPVGQTTSTHSLRHTYASYLLSREGGNQSLQYVANVLGDTQAMVQEVYAHLMPEEKASQANVVRDALEVI